MAIRILVLEEIYYFLRMFDSPGTYLMLIVFAMVILPYYVKSVYGHMKNPQEYYMVSFEKKLWIGFLLILFLLVFGIANFIRFIPS